MNYEKGLKSMQELVPTEKRGEFDLLAADLRAILHDILLFGSDHTVDRQKYRVAAKLIHLGRELKPPVSFVDVCH